MATLITLTSVIFSDFQWFSSHICGGVDPPTKYGIITRNFSDFFDGFWTRETGKIEGNCQVVRSAGPSSSWQHVRCKAALELLGLCMASAANYGRSTGNMISNAWDGVAWPLWSTPRVKSLAIKHEAA